MVLARLRAPLRSHCEPLTLLSLALTSILLHLVPFFAHGAAPLGYDTGFYRRYLTEPIISFPNTGVPGLGSDALVPRMLFDALRLLHIPTDTILYGTYLTWFVLLPLLLYYFLKPSLGKKGATIAAALLIFSSVQYAAYWYMLWKSAFALCLLLGAYIAIERRQVAWWFALDVALALSHKTTALIYLATLGVMFLLGRGRRKEMALHGVVVAVFLLAANATLAHKIALAAPVGVFLEWGDYLRLSLPLLLATAVGIRSLRPKALPLPLLALTLVSFAFVGLHLPFFERVFVYSDMALVALTASASAYLLRQSLQHKKTLRGYAAAAVLCLVIGFLLGNLRNEVRSFMPLITSSSIAQIEAVGALVPSSATILTSSAEAPWYEGWTGAHIAAPGLLHDNHNLESWNAFWDSTSTPYKIKFLGGLPQPLYISSTDSFDFLIGKPLPCMTKLSPVLLRNDCK